MNDRHSEFRRTATRQRLALLILVVAVAIMAAKFFQSGEPANSQALLAQAVVLVDAKKLDEARELLETILARESDNLTARLYLGQVEWDGNQHQKAFEQWSRIPDDPPETGAMARYLEGAARLARNEAREAESRLVKAHTLDPQSKGSIEKLLEIYALQLRPDETRDVLDELRLLRPLTLQELAMELLAGTPVYGIDRHQAKLESFIQTDSNDLQSHLGLVRLKLSQGHAAEAHEILDNAPGDLTMAPNAVALLVDVHLQRGRFHQAAQLLNSTQLSADSGALSWKNYGLILAESGDRSQALTALDYASQKAVFDLDLNHRRALLAREMDDNPKAEELLKRGQVLDRIEQNAFLILRSAGRHPALVSQTILEIAEALAEIQHVDIAKEWVSAGQSVSPEHPGLEQLESELAQTAVLSRSQIESPPQQMIQLDRLADRPQEVNQPGTPSIQMKDIAAELGLGGQFDTGNSGKKWIIETVGGGVGVADFDLDGKPDLFFPQGGSALTGDDAHAPLDVLYRNQYPDKFLDVTQRANLTDRGYSQGCSFGDYNNDGAIDLFVTNVGHNVLYENNGDGTLSIVESPEITAPEAASSSVGWGDFDSDGLLDLYVVNYVEDWQRVCRNGAGEISTCLPSGFAAAQDQLLRNQGDGTFADLTASSGIVQSDGRGLGLLITDFDKDDRADIYVANDGSANFLFHNTSQSGEIRFHEIGLLAGVGVSDAGRTEAGMGIASADFDRNGLVDLFVTNFYQEENRLYLNEGDMLFRDATAESGLGLASRMVLGFGTQAVDLDFDGDEDLIVANGDIDNYEAFGRPYRMSPQVFQNVRNAQFAEVSESSGSYFQGKYLGRGVARIDVDGDGVWEVVIVHQDRPTALLRCNSTVGVTAISVRISGTNANRTGIGCEVTLDCGERQYVQALQGGCGYCCSNQPEIRFLLPAESKVRELSIRSPGGFVTTYDTLPEGEKWIVCEGYSVRSARH